MLLIRHIVNNNYLYKYNRVKTLAPSVESISTFGQPKGPLILVLEIPIALNDGTLVTEREEVTEGCEG